MRLHSHNVGVMLAILAGLTSFGVALWPFGAPQTRVVSSPVWLAITAAAGAAFLAAAIIVDRWPGISKLLLVIGGLALAASGSFFATLFGLGEARLAAVIDLTPAVLALIAAVLIGPIVTQRGTL
jgi:hypothetical protein